MEIPAQDSPKHILNCLDDYIIQRIFFQLETQMDILNVAETCQRFRQNAKSCVTLKFKCIIIGTLEKCDRWTFLDLDIDKYYISLDRVNDFLSIFRYEIESIHFFATRERKVDEEVARTIGIFCGETLAHLQLYRFESTFPKQFAFSSLKTLKLFGCFANYFIRRGRDGGLELPFEFKKYPRLTNLWIENYIPGLTHDNLFKFLSINPQLRVLSLRTCFNLNNRNIFEDIVKYATNIEHLTYYHDKDHMEVDYMNPALYGHFGKLPNLKHLRIDDFDQQINNIIDALAENNSHIESLDVYGFCSFLETQSSEKVRKDNTNFRKLNSLKQLEFKGSTDYFAIANLLTLLPSVETVKVVDLFGRRNKPDPLQYRLTWIRQMTTWMDQHAKHVCNFTVCDSSRDFFKWTTSKNFTLPNFHIEYKNKLGVCHYIMRKKIKK